MLVLHHRQQLPNKFITGALHREESLSASLQQGEGRQTPFTQTLLFFVVMYVCVVAGDDEAPSFLR